MDKKAFNDMLGKGFDSAKQESYLWQKYEADPDEWSWVPEVYAKHGHAWDFEDYSNRRNDKGQYTTFTASTVERLTKMADKLDAKQYSNIADLIDQLLQRV